MNKRDRQGLNRGDCDPAHRAGPDTYVTAFILRELLNKVRFDDLVAWSDQPALLPKISFGKHRGAKWSDVPADYLDWIIRKSEMDEDVKFTASHYLSKR